MASAGEPSSLQHGVASNASKAKRRRINQQPSSGNAFNQHLSLPDLPLGPQTAAESVRWAPQLLDQLAAHSKKYFGVDFALQAEERLRCGICLRTDYSGLGSPEEALSKILVAVQSHSFAEFQCDPKKFCCQRAGDIESCCRQVLLSHEGVFKPSCVHGDILERCPPEVLKLWNTMQHAAKERANAKVDSGDDINSSFLDEGRAFVRQALATLTLRMSTKGARQKFLNAPCHAHQSKCPVIQKTKPRLCLLWKSTSFLQSCLAS